MGAVINDSKLRRATGLVLIFLTAVIWIVTSFISESLVHAKGTARAVVPPILLTYLATTLFTLYLPLIHIHSWIQDCLIARKQGGCRNISETTTLLQKSAAKQRKDSSGENMARTAALWATPLWFLAQLAFNLSLAYTSVTSNTILSSTSSLFTFGFSIFLLGEHYTWKKLLCIFSCMAGTAVVTLADAEGSSDSKPIWGDALVLASAALYACYTVVMRKKMPGEEGEAHVAEFFGYVGLYTTISMAPVMVFLIAIGTIDVVAIPKEAYLIILLEGLLDYVLSDYLWAKGVMILGPTVATLCLSVQIPIAAGAELVVGQPRWAQNPHTVMMAVTGTLLILAGFFGINLLSGGSGESEAEKHKSEERSQLDAVLTRRKSKDSGSGDEAEAGNNAHAGGGEVSERCPLLAAEEGGALRGGKAV